MGVESFLSGCYLDEIVELNSAWAWACADRVHARSVSAAERDCSRFFSFAITIGRLRQTAPLIAARRSWSTNANRDTFRW